ncbi:MAG: MFS transporter [Sellimonas intestinalis]
MKQEKSPLTSLAATYITPMIGYLADYWVSPRLCVVLGMILMGAGYLVGWQATNSTLVWVMIILVAVGTGLFKGNLSGVNSLMFDDQDELNSAFSVQYSFVNIGSFIGTTFSRTACGFSGISQFLLLIAGILPFW